jgi:lambda repressor-like predicted transcriptional regulator
VNFFPPKFFFAQKDFPFSKIPEKILAGKNSLSKKGWSFVVSADHQLKHNQCLTSPIPSKYQPNIQIIAEITEISERKKIHEKFPD